MSGERGVRVDLPPDGASHRTYRPALMAALDRFQEAAVLASTLDPVTVELVRLRCARVHDCRTCRQLRLEPARAAGADEALLDRIDRYETSDLDPRHKAALRLTDAHLFGAIGPTLAADVARHFSPAEADQIVLLVAKFSFQKSLVALGLDAAGSTTLFTFADDGSAVRL